MIPKAMLSFFVALASSDALMAVGRPQDLPSGIPEEGRQKYALRATGRRSQSFTGVSTAVASGLRWLQTHQDENGRWQTDHFMKHDKAGTPTDGAGNGLHDCGISGLALLAFLADGQTPTNGEFADTVRRGAAWLCAQQGDNGAFGRNVMVGFVYDHVIATIAVTEAYGLSGDATLKAHAQSGIDYIEASRNTYGVWRYQPRDNDNDTSVTGWCACALQTAADCGLKVNRDSLGAVLFWMDGVTDSSGRSGYLKLGDGSSRFDRDHARRFPPTASEALTGIALHSRFMLGKRPGEAPIMERQAVVMLARLPVWSVSDGSIDLYYWFHATNALRQFGGDAWLKWWAALRNALLPNQRKDGNFAGSWDPICVWGEVGGRVYSTAIATLCLQAESRYAQFSTVTPLPKSPIFSVLNQNWLSGQYGRFSAGLASIEKAEGLSDKDKAAIDGARRALQTVVNDAFSEVRSLEQTSGRLQGYLPYVGATERLETIRKGFGNLPPGEGAEAVIGKWKADHKLQREITAARRYEAITKQVEGRPNKAQRDALIMKLEGFVDSFGDTRAGADAEAWPIRLKQQR